ncbi:MAG: glycosyltransferase family 2 protein [Planctomycetota bacterium]
MSTTAARPDVGQDHVEGQELAQPKGAAALQPLAPRQTECAVTIAIPAFNEAGAIADVVRGLRSRYPDYEVLVVDDGSTDGTGELATEAGATVIRHEYNRGYGASLKTGCRQAQGEIVVCFDGDGQHDAEDVQRLLDQIGPHDMAVGMRGQGSHKPLLRRPGKAVLAAFANFLAGTRIPDVNSGLRAFKRHVILRYLHLMPNGFSFSTTSTFAMLKSGRSVAWIPIQVKKRIGNSSVSQVRHGSQTLLLMLRLTTLFEPLKVFLPVSGAFLLVALLFLSANLASGRAVPQTSVIMSVSSIMVFLMGLLMDQVASLRREKHE